MRPRAFIRGLGAALLLAASLGALAQHASESAVKAAFLFRFASYVEWPQQATAQPEMPFVFGVAGSDEVASELEKIVAGRAISSRRAVVRRVTDASLARGVHVLFVGKGEPAAATLLREARQHGALTVTETERGLEAGSAINFVVAENRVGFEISLEAAERGGHRISSRMLAVARRVVPRS